MDKPTIFFSHSTQDSPILKSLKKEVLEITGNSVEIFLSSDGQSIPLGKNWVSEIEEALDDSSIMFVFISQNSLDSQWIYFEAGYGYSKGISVVPIGILGIDIGEVGSPLSLLQGFNLDSYKKLNNIIAKINKQYDRTFNENFDEATYERIFDPIKSEHFEAAIFHVVDQILIFLESKLSLKKISTLLNKHDIHHHLISGGGQIYMYGAHYDLNSDILYISPTKFFELKELVIELATLEGENKKNQNLQIRIALNDNFSLTSEYRNVSEKLEDKIQIFEGKYQYSEQVFNLTKISDTNSYIDIFPQNSFIDLVSVKEIIYLLIERGLIFSRTGYY